MKIKDKMLPVTRVIVIAAAVFMSAVAAAPKTKTKAQCKAELNHCMYQTCKNVVGDTACVNRCSKNAQSCMLGAKN